MTISSGRCYQYIDIMTAPKAVEMDDMAPVEAGSPLLRCKFGSSGGSVADLVLMHLASYW